MSIGERLQNTREMQGLSIEEISRKTFIRPHFLEAIEREDFSSLPPSRVRFFVRDYARTLGLPVDEILAELPEIAPPSAPVVAPPPVTVKESPSSFSSSPDDPEEDVPRGSRKRPRYSPISQGNPMMVRGIMAVALLLLIAIGAYYLTNGFGTMSSDESASVSDSAKGTQEGDDSEVRILSRSEGNGQGTDSAQNALVNLGAGDSLVLEGRAVDRVWYAVSMDGERQQTETLDSGMVKVWRASEKFSVSLGNAGGMDLYLNGKLLEKLGERGELVRNKVVTAEGVKQSQTVAPRRRSSTTRRRRRAKEPTTPSVRRVTPTEQRSSVGESEE